LKNKIFYYFNHWYEIPIVKNVFKRTKSIILPGFDGIPVFYVFRFLYDEAKQDKLSTRANSMAFSLFLSLFPAIIFLFTLLPHLDITHQLENTISNSIQSLLPRSASQYLLAMIHDITNIKRSGLLSVGFLLAAYFSSQGMLTMMTGFDKNHIKGFKRRTYFQKILVSLGLTIILLLLVITSGTLIVLGDIIVGALEKLLKFEFLNNILVFIFRWALSFTIIYFAITIIYKYAPSMTSKVQFWNAGSFVSTVLSLLSSLVFAFFVNNFGKYNEVYGSIGALMVLLLWLKINSFILLFGFEVNTSIHANKHRKMFPDLTNNNPTI